MFPVTLILCLALAVPGWVGYSLLQRTRAHDFRRFAGVLTLKPIIATPMWLILAEPYLFTIVDTTDPRYVLTIVPGISMTIIILWYFRHSLLSLNKLRVGLLIVLDTARWVSTFAVPQLESQWFISLFMPTVFAFVAWFISQDT